MPLDADPLTQELVAFLAAGLAFGNVRAIKRSVDRAAANLDNPAGLAEIGHRWVRGPDLVAVVGRLRELQSRFGSLEAHFLTTYEPGDMRGSMTRWTADLRGTLEPTRGVVTLTTDASAGSACKRLNLLMRWLVRTGSTDLGLWPSVRAADLMIPLDVHLIAYARTRGLTVRRGVNWVMAEEVTQHFRGLCPEDPLRWDFTISHAGMMAGWDG